MVTQEAVEKRQESIHRVERRAAAAGFEGKGVFAGADEVVEGGEIEAGRVAFRPGVIALVRRVYQEPILPTGHVNLLTAPEARRKLDRAGFQVLDSSTSGVYLPVVAELAGRAALRLEQWLERRLAGGRLDGLLWIQYHLARA